RYARPRLLNIDTRIREIRSAGSGSQSQSQGESLCGYPIALSRQIDPPKLSAFGVQQDRVFDDLSGEELFGEPGYEDHLKRHASSCVGRPDEHAAVTAMG